MAVNISQLFSHIPAIINEMEDVFSSHEFIRRLMWRQQGLFVEALYAYRNDAPFRKVHARISNELRNYPQFIRYIGHRNSPDVFGEIQGCAFWQKVGAAAAAPPDEAVAEP
jgi:hypothetical protein